MLGAKCCSNPEEAERVGASQHSVGGVPYGFGRDACSVQLPLALGLSIDGFYVVFATTCGEIPVLVLVGTS